MLGGIDPVGLTFDTRAGQTVGSRDDTQCGAVGDGATIFMISS